MELAMSGGADAITVSAVAAKAGLARTSVYEYFSSSADLISDLIMEELEYYRLRLLTAVGNVEDPYLYIELWIAEALAYIADGRHMMAKSLNSISVPEYRRAEIGQAHRALMATISQPLTDIGLADIRGAISYLQNTLDTASVRIDSGNEAALEIQYAQRYAMAGLRALATANES